MTKTETERIEQAKDDAAKFRAEAEREFRELPGPIIFERTTIDQKIKDLEEGRTHITASDEELKELQELAKELSGESVHD